MAQRKSLTTVKQATALAFKEMTSVFYTYHLIALVRGITTRPHLMDGTILRRLRELREEQPKIYGYEVLNQEASQYKKRELQPANTLAQ